MPNALLFPALVALTARRAGHVVVVVLAALGIALMSFVESI